MDSCCWKIDNWPQHQYVIIILSMSNTLIIQSAFVKSYLFNYSLDKCLDNSIKNVIFDTVIAVLK
jgi:hypothetical protein